MPYNTAGKQTAGQSLHEVALAPLNSLSWDFPTTTTEPRSKSDTQRSIFLSNDTSFGDAQFSQQGISQEQKVSMLPSPNYSPNVIDLLTAKLSKISEVITKYLNQDLSDIVRLLDFVDQNVEVTVLRVNLNSRVILDLQEQLNNTTSNIEGGKGSGD